MFSLAVESHHCRLCALKSDNVIEIFQKEGTSIDLAGKISQCLQIRLSPDDILPRSICVSCCEKVLDFTHFFNVCIKSQDYLSHVYYAKSIRPEPDDVASPKDLGLCFNFNTFSSDDGKIVLDDSSNSFSEAGENANFHLVKSSLEKEIPSPIQESNVSLPYQSDVVEDSLILQKSMEIIQQKPCDANTEVSLDDVKSKESESSTGNSIFPSNDNNFSEESEDDFDNCLEDAQAQFIKSTWKCGKCDLELTALKDLREHSKKEHNEDPLYKCSAKQCSKSYSRHRSYVRHIKTHVQPRKFSCEICGKSFTQKTILQSHTVVHAENRPHVCAYCGKAFKTFSTLYLHGRSHIPSKDKPKFECNICSKELASKSTLEYHVKGHLGEKNFICDVCGKRFISKGSLQYHFKSHVDEKPFKCQVCGRPFMTERLLSKHISVHTGLKPYQCDTCGKQFRERNTLKEHSRIHTGDMPYSCEFCGKMFRFKGILTVHRRLHTGERPYSCSACDKKFTNWANYNKHMKRLHSSDTKKRVQHQADKILLPATSSLSMCQETVLSDISPVYATANDSSLSSAQISTQDLYRDFSAAVGAQSSQDDLSYYLPQHSVFTGSV